MSAKRIANLRRKLKAENLEGMIFTDLDQIRYLTGFTGSAGLCIVTARQADFFTDSRYTVQAGQQVKGARVHTVRGALIAGLKDFPHLNGKNRRLGFAGEHVTIAARRFLGQSLPDCLLTPADSVVAELGWIKEKSELASIERAVKIADIAYERILNLVAPGVRERELAAELEYQMTMLGSEKAAFRTIVASGYRSAMPHGVASGKKLKKGDFVTFDFGADVDGYCSDITRTVVLGRATSRQKRIYNTVLQAQMAGIRKVRPGVTGVAVDATCRGIITRAGFGKNFGHGTGHGIGFCFRSGPRLSSVSRDNLKTNNVITVEPGIYIDGWGGVRIEDDVVVTRTGARVLNKAEKKLLEL